MTFVTFCCALESSCLSLVLPSIDGDLHGTYVDAFWIGTSFLLASAVSQPVLTSLSMLLGRKLVRCHLQSIPLEAPQTPLVERRVQLLARCDVEHAIERVNIIALPSRLCKGGRNSTNDGSRYSKALTTSLIR